VPLLCLLQGQLPPDLSAHLKALNSNCDLRGGVLPALVRALAGCSCGGEGGLQFTAERLAAANAHAAAQGYSSSAAGDSAVAAGPGAYRCWEEDAREAAKRLLRHFTAVRQHLQRHAVVTLDHKVAVAEAWLARVPHDCDLRPCGVCGIRDERHANRARMEVWEVPGHYTDPETELPGMELLLLDGDLAQAFAPGGRLAGSVELRTAAGEARQVSLKELYNIHTTPVGPAGTEDSPVDAPPAPGLEYQLYSHLVRTGEDGREEVDVCIDCNRALSAGKVPEFSLKAGREFLRLHHPEYADVLPRLSLVEKMLLSHQRLYGVAIKVMQTLGAGFRWVLTSHTIAFFHKGPELAAAALALFSLAESVRTLPERLTVAFLGPEDKVGAIEAMFRRGLRQGGPSPILALLAILAKRAFEPLNALQGHLNV
jgi:hypothetical protein